MIKCTLESCNNNTDKQSGCKLFNVCIFGCDNGFKPNDSSCERYEPKPDEAQADEQISFVMCCNATRKFYTIVPFFEYTQFNGYFTMKRNKLILCRDGYYSPKDLTKDKMVIFNSREKAKKAISDYMLQLKIDNGCDKEDVLTKEEIEEYCDLDFRIIPLHYCT